MGAIPTPRTWADGDIPPYTVVNAEVYQTVQWLLQPPMCKVRQTTTQSIPNGGTATALIFQTEDSDPYNWHNANVNPTRVTPTFPGWYRGWYSIGFSTATGGNIRLGELWKNGVAARARRDAKPPVIGSTISLRGIPFFLALNGTTDYLEVRALQDSGSAMSTPVSNHNQAELFLRWWGPL